LLNVAVRKFAARLQAQVHEVEATQIRVLLTAIAIVAFWRTVVRWLIVLVSIAIIATLDFCLIMIWQTTHHTAG
jgi:hypothetical protein